MPSTINGIGTHYYGKQELITRPAVCPHCGAHVTLSSYTTRLWFVVVFIPIIPLKRYRILDSCPSCTRHWAVDPEKYETSRQEEISAALEKHRADPSIESALITHATCLGYQMYHEADLFRQGALTQFPNQVDLLNGLAAHLNEVGRWQDATPLYEQSFALQPDNHDVRFSLAWRRTDEGRLDEAYQLLDYLRVPGVGTTYKMEPLHTLAQAYQKQGDHERALELWQHYLREVPAAQHQHSVRKLVAKSEKAQGHESSLLPEKEFSVWQYLDPDRGTRGWVLGGLALGLFLTVMAATNEYIRRHRTLHVVSAFAQPVQVAVDGGPPIEVSRSTIPLSEGRHTVAITGPISKQLDIDVRAPYFSRWFSKPVWVLDIERLSGVFEETIHYAAVPRPSESRWMTEEFVFIPHADYVFQEAPATLRIEGRDSVVTKIRVGSLPLDPPMRLLSSEGRDPAMLFTFAEGHLERNPRDSVLLHIYATLAKDAAGEQHVEQYLRSRLWQPPVSVEWHRQFQSLKSIQPRQAELLPEYDAQLAKSPNDATLLYLRGRISPERAEQLRYFRSSAASDPELGWAAMALAIDATNRADWPEAKRWCDQAAPQLGVDQTFQAVRHTIHLALGDTSQELHYRQSLSSSSYPEMIGALFRLTDLLASLGQMEQARLEHRNWYSRMAPGEANSPYQLMIDYCTADTESFLQKQATLNPNEISSYQFQFLLATGQPDAVLQRADQAELLETWDAALALSVSYAIQGNAKEADRWRATAVEQLRQGESDNVRAANLLEHAEAPTDAELDEIVLMNGERALWLAALAQRFPERRADLNRRAEQINVSRQPPYLLVKQAIAQP